MSRRPEVMDLLRRSRQVQGWESGVRLEFSRVRHPEEGGVGGVFFNFYFFIFLFFDLKEVEARYLGLLLQ